MLVMELFTPGVLFSYAMLTGNNWGSPHWLICTLACDCRPWIQADRIKR